MIVIFGYGAPIAVMLLYGNIVCIMKKVKNGEDTENKTIVGGILSAFILVSIFAICGR
ncbi:hypothetical protein [Clostridium sp.]|uniref:hypothetical protein n=1 Tax=Clostridium sp. TaxID=1506 RepID=UPI003EE8E48C